MAARREEEEAVIPIEPGEDEIALLEPNLEPNLELQPVRRMYDPQTGLVADLFMLDDNVGNGDGIAPMEIDGENGIFGDENGAEADKALSHLVMSVLGNGRGNGNRKHPVRRGPTGIGGTGGSGDGGDDDDDDDPLAKVTLDDIGGLEDQVTWLQKCVLSHLKDDDKLKAFGIDPPKGILFYGPPGTGKTLLARAFGNELKKITGKKVAFFHRRGPDCYSPWLGESSKKLRQIFATAVRAKPSVIFFDELDGLCPTRGGRISQGATSVVTSLLGCMDELVPGEVFVFGATNLIESIDPALIRPGRFDKHLEFFPPSLEARKRIIQIHTKKWKQSHPDEEQLTEIAGRTHGFTGADLEMLARQALQVALDRTIKSIHTFDENSPDFVNMEVERRDWNTALKRVKPSPTVYNAAVSYVPTLPDPRIRPLTEANQMKILETLKECLETIPNKAVCINRGQLDPTVHIIQTLAVVEPETCTASTHDSLGTYVLPAIFADKDISQLPVYVLSAQRLFASPNGPLNCLMTTFKAVLSCKRKCILYIPTIDALYKGAPELFLPLAHHLQLLNAKPVLVLVTSFMPVTEFPTRLNFQAMFLKTKRVIQYLPPTRTETLDFLVPLFNILKDMPKKKSLVTMQATDRVWKCIGAMLKDKSIKEHLTMYDAMREIINPKNKTVTFERAVEEIEQFIEDYDFPPQTSC